ncbi:MAG TPA: NAD(P)H-binding protein, partial [Fimbriimonas sp.]|nr:NAD(P)H-binding protein [Fimbriimonas sp.]
MKFAITGGTGFAGRHLAKQLLQEGHEVVLISRGVDTRDITIRSTPNTTFQAIGISDKDALSEAFRGCSGVAHLGGINREIGNQTYQKVHVEGTANVIEAAKNSGVQKILLLSFIRARPNCGSGYHETKWQAEELIRASGLDYTIFKAGVVYGKGDHLLDHISHALHTFPIFLNVGFEPVLMKPLAVED